jgi:hypothetical protein
VGFIVIVPASHVLVRLYFMNIMLSNVVIEVVSLLGNELHVVYQIDVLINLV